MLLSGGPAALCTAAPLAVQPKAVSTGARAESSSRPWRGGGEERGGEGEGREMREVREEVWEEVMEVMEEFREEVREEVRRGIRWGGERS